MTLNGVETVTNAANGQAVFTQIINQPNLWSAEFPNLYALTLQLKDATGQITRNGYQSHRHSGVDHYQRRFAVKWRAGEVCGRLQS